MSVVSNNYTDACMHMIPLIKLLCNAAMAEEFRNCLESTEERQ